MTEKEYDANLNKLWTLYKDICKFLNNFVFDNYEIAFEYQERHHNVNLDYDGFCKQFAEYQKYLKEAIELSPASSLEEVLIIWKRELMRGEFFLEWCENNISPQAYLAPRKEGKNIGIYNDEVWDKVKQANQMEKSLAVTYSNELNQINLGLATDDASPNSNINQNEVTSTNQDSQSILQKYNELSKTNKELIVTNQKLQQLISELEDKLAKASLQIEYLSKLANHNKQ